MHDARTKRQGISSLAQLILSLIASRLRALVL